MKHFLFLYTDIYPTNIGRGTISHIARILLIFSSGQTKLIARQKHEHITQIYAYTHETVYLSHFNLLII